jgi:ATP-dependent protease ClpP protease subunit
MKIRLNGDIVDNDTSLAYRYFGFEVCCPRDLRQALEQCPEGEDLELEMNSYGGSVYAGFEMYSILRSSGKTVTAKVQSIAASAMSVVMAGCQRVLLSPVANVMIHRAGLSGVSGNTEDMTQTAQWLNTIDESILNAYEEKSAGKATREQFKQWMEEETFFTAEQAIACGLADEMLDKPAAQDFVASAGGENTYNKTVVKELLKAVVENRIPPAEDIRRMAAEQGLNITEEGVSDNQKNSERQEDEEMEPKNLEELTAAYPELMAQAMTKAATAERERIQSIEDMALPGFEDIVEKAKADPTATAADVATAIVAKQRASGNAWMAQARDDATQGGANEVAGAAAPEKGKDESVSAANAVSLWKKSKGGDEK